MLDLNEITCPFCHKKIEPYYENGKTTVPDITGKDKIIDMGSWWGCPECDEELEDYEPNNEVDYDD